MGHETPYEWAQRRRSEGASVEALAQELAAAGLGPVEIDRLLDRDVRPSPAEQPDPVGGGGMASPQLLLGIFLLIGGLILLVSGWVSWRALLLLVAGAARIATARGVARPSSAKQEEARLAMIQRALDDSQQRCAVHPEYAAMGTCPRCGSFCCALCTPGRGFGGGRVCMQCQALPEVQSARRRSASRGAALTLLSGPAMIVVLLALERVVFASSLAPMRALVALLVVSAPWLLLAALQANARSGWPAVVSVVPWLAVEGALLVGSGLMPAMLWLLPLGVTFYGWESTRQAARGEPAYLLEMSPPAAAQT